MKRIEIRNIEELLRKVNLRKVSKDTASAALKLHLALFGADKETTEKMEETRKALLNGRDEEVQKLTSLRDEVNKTEDQEEIKKLVATIAEECGPILETERELGRQYDMIMNEVVKVKIEKLSPADVMELLEVADVDYTVTTLESLSSIIK